ncbi:MAG: hypothetical protein LBL94_05935 [Prevotellaceae bacterium]|nr:hypothetical protein [Prevotellaceae bacterium]
MLIVMLIAMLIYAEFVKPDNNRLAALGCLTAISVTLCAMLDGHGC